MPPKRQTKMPNRKAVKKAKTTPSVQAPKVQSRDKVASTKGWEFAPFTKKAVGFNKAAKALATAIARTYGDQVSIAQFEKLCIAFPSLRLEEKELVFLNEELVQLLLDYQTARTARDLERATFRGDIKVDDVQGAMATLCAEFGVVENSTAAERG
jgi:hypothetical protein